MTKTDFTIEDMRRFAAEAWGPLGANVVERWAAFNARHFDGVLKPIPLVITNTLPHGGALAFCSHSSSGCGRTITLNVPKTKAPRGTVAYELLADNNTLLHEMIHQFLFERGEDASHKADGWRREIMRLNLAMTGNPIWAGRSRTMRVLGEDGKKSKVIRANMTGGCGEPSLTQMQIARWPHDGMGIDLGPLG